MQIRLSKCETAAPNDAGLNIFQLHISLLTDFLSHSVPLHFSCTHNSTSLFSPKYSTSPCHVGINDDELAPHKQNRTALLTRHWIARGDVLKLFPRSPFETINDRKYCELSPSTTIITCYHSTGMGQVVPT